MYGDDGDTRCGTYELDQTNTDKVVNAIAGGCEDGCIYTKRNDRTGKCTASVLLVYCKCTASVKPEVINIGKHN